MRVAPVALFFREPEPLIAAKVAVLTHGHELGWLSAAALMQIINRIVYGGCKQGDTLLAIVDECQEMLKEQFAGAKHLGELLGSI